MKRQFKRGLAWLVITILITGMMPTALLGENFSASVVGTNFSLAEWGAANPTGLPNWISATGGAVSRFGTGIHLSGRNQDWHGIDLLDSVISFQEGDTVTVTGMTWDDNDDEEWGTVFLNIQPGGWVERGQGGDLTYHGSFTSTLTITDNDLNTIRGANPPGIRIQTNNLPNTEITISDIQVVRGSGGGEPVSKFALDLGAPSLVAGFNDRVQWTVTGNSAQMIPEAEYFVMVADFAELRAINGDGMGGTALIHNPHAGGWNQTDLNGGWFSWEEIVRNSAVNMNVTTVLHQGVENGGRLEFAIPMPQLSGYPFASANANLVFAIWGNDGIFHAITNAYFDTQLPSVPGNATGSGRVTSADATAIARYVVNGTPVNNMRGADTNCDGMVDLSDVTRLLRALVGYYPDGICPNGGCVRC
jgi:hypothetical protein